MATTFRALFDLRSVFAAITLAATATAATVTPGAAVTADGALLPGRKAPLAVSDPALSGVFVGSANWVKIAEYRALSKFKNKSVPVAIAYLVKNQRADGSWSFEGLPDRGWYFDHTTGDALRALLEYYLETGDQSVVAPAKKTIELLLRTQGKEVPVTTAPYLGGPFALTVGGLWRKVPDPKEWPEDWWSYLGNTWTLGDGTTSAHVEALTMAYGVFGDKRCKEAVLACARSLQKLQDMNKMGLPEHVGPRGEAMYGRPMEIPAWSTRAACCAIDVYVNAHRVSKDRRWADQAKKTAVWLEPLKLSSKPLSFQNCKPDIMWPSMVEMNTLKPVYGNAYGQTVYTLNEAYNPYGWWTPYPLASIGRAKAYFLQFTGSW